MTPKEAAQVIGCSVDHCRRMARTGKLRARKRKTTGGYEYSITRREAERVRDLTHSKGWKRGKPRT